MNNDTQNNFIGSGWSFPPRFCSKTRNVELVSYEQDIKESIRILLSTTPGERIMQPSFGCELKRMVFNSITESIITKLRDSVERAILFFEPRVNLERVNVSANYDSLETNSAYDGVLHISIDYTIRKTNTRSNMVYPFYYIEGTNLQSIL